MDASLAYIVCITSASNSLYWFCESFVTGGELSADKGSLHCGFPRKWT